MRTAYLTHLGFRLAMNTAEWNAKPVDRRCVHVRYCRDMNQLWAEFLRYSARQSKVGAVRTLDGVEAAWMNSALMICNGTVFTSAPSDEEDLCRRLELAKADGAAHAMPWVLFTYDPWLEKTPIPAESGFARAMGVRVMTGDVNCLKPPVRPMPQVEFRRVEDETSARHAIDINMKAYGLPSEVTESVLATGGYFADPSRDYAYVAYVDDEQVSTTTVILLDGWLYVALVATAPGHRNKGYAEAVMRHALEQACAATGVTKTSLDATDAGAPLYAQMGYEGTGETWGMWMMGG
jgi:GNAT superfamily N-acetyltransferase